MADSTRSTSTWVFIRGSVTAAVGLADCRNAIHTPAGAKVSSSPVPTELRDEPKARVFYALWLPSRLRPTVAAMARNVAREARGRAVPGENLHLTLAFVGDVSAPALPVLCRIGASVAQRLVGTEAKSATQHLVGSEAESVPQRGGGREAGEEGGGIITLDRLGAFARARVAWLGPSSIPPALATLVRALEGELDAARLPYDRRPFQPHLTLVRSYRDPFPERAIDPVAWSLDALVLLRSPRGIPGGRYDELARWTLDLSARDRS